MNTRTIILTIAALLFGIFGGYLLSSQTTIHSNSVVATNEMAAAPEDMHRMPDGSMMHHDDHTETASMDHMDTMMVASERDFITGMIPHHQEAIDTAHAVLARGGTTPEIRQLAEAIIVAQTAEIAALEEWHEEWYDEAYVATGDYAPMMRDLSQLSGQALDRTFLEDMVMHHMGAIMMARSVQPYIEHPAIEELARTIITTQSDEIQVMQQLINEL